MIFYNHDREAFSDSIKYSPRTCFILTQLGGNIPHFVANTRKIISSILAKKNISETDANSLITGRDFMNKIWRQILGVPMGIAVVSGEMSIKTIANIFYEIGVLNALGKETIVVKSNDFEIPSDFVRTEYINYNKKFKDNFEKFITNILELPEYYDTLAINLLSNPSLQIDYLRRAFLISGDVKYQNKAKKIFQVNRFDNQTKKYINSFLLYKK